MFSGLDVSHLLHICIHTYTTTISLCTNQLKYMYLYQTKNRKYLPSYMYKDFCKSLVHEQFKVGELKRDRKCLQTGIYVK